MTMVGDILKYLAGTLRTEQPVPLDFDARTVALNTLATYLSLCRFSRTGGVGEQPIVFRIPRDSIFPEQPDNVVDAPLPSIGVVANEGQHENYNLGPPEVHDATADVYGKGTALVELGDYVEELNLEVWAATIPERRALTTGLREAFSPLEESSALRLKLPDYYDRIATFELIGTRRIEDTAHLGRRKAQLRVRLTVPEVALVRYVRFTRVEAIVETTDGQVEALEKLREVLASYQAPQT